jgi:Fic family protein
MWNIDLKYRETYEATFTRLVEKRDTLNLARPLNSYSLHKIQDAFTVEWTYNSNSIEGNTLSLNETHMIINEGFTIRGKSMREHLEAKNHQLALHQLYKLVQEGYILNDSDILKLHELVLHGIEEDFAGRLRTSGVRISGANFIPPNALKVSQFLDELIAFVNDNPLQLNEIELATVFHHKFVWIHPFFDGNGRTVRLVMNLILMSKGFPPAIILSVDRKKYYDALNQANSGNYDKLMLLMCQSIERSLNIYLSAIPNNDLEYDSISNIVSEPGTPYGMEYVSLLARQGKIDAYKEGKNWYTSKKAIEDYMQNRQRKRIV